MSTDTSEQILVDQQIETKDSLDQSLTSETGLPAEHLILGLEQSQHGTIGTESLSTQVLCEVDQLQSPFTASAGTIRRHYAGRSVCLSFIFRQKPAKG